MNKILGGLLIAGVAWGLTPPAVSSDRWIHVRVDDAGDSNAKVDIQVPVGLVSALLPVLKDKHGSGTIHMDGKRMDVDELRGYWKAVRDAKDGDYVTVRDHESDVRVGKSGGFLKVNVHERDGGSRVRMTIPIALVDALFAAGDTLDVDAIESALGKVPLGELVTVDDADSHVRIWIDTEAAPVREDRP
jgi:hypothetical protein